MSNFDLLSNIFLVWKLLNDEKDKLSYSVVDKAELLFPIAIINIFMFIEAQLFFKKNIMENGISF